MPRVLAFDVNETLLDLSALDERFARAFGDAAVRRQWFAQMLQIAFVGGLTGRYVDFTAAARGALEMVGAIHGVDARDAGIVEGMRELPAHPDAGPGLARLRDAGFRLAALTNSTLEVARSQLAHAALDAHFEAILSADQVRSLKPRPEPYRLVADTFGVGIGEVRLVAAHGWDVAGALAAGCAAAFVARPGAVPIPLGPQPDVTGADLLDVAAALVC